MAGKGIRFGKADVIGEGSNTDIDTVEEDVVVVTDLGYLTFSQLSIYVTINSLGTHTAIDLRLYVLDEISGTWVKLPIVNSSTYEIEDYYYRYVSGSPTPSIIDIPISAAFGIKVTGQGVGGANGSVTIKLLGRSN